VTDSSPAITVREATEDDFPWMRERVVESSAYSIPYGRDVSNDLVRVCANEDFDRLVSERDHMVFLVACNEHSERMGLLILNLAHRSDATGEPQSLIEDLDVEPRFWGTAAVSYLVKRAAQVTAENGLGYMVGHVSVGNRRTLLKSLRLGFQIERYHFCMGCDPSGPTPMPGRAESQRAHDVSRAQRKLLARRRAKKRKKSST
jgi:hypothetical protein